VKRREVSPKRRTSRRKGPGLGHSGGEKERMYDVILEVFRSRTSTSRWQNIET